MEAPANRLVGVPPSSANREQNTFRGARWSLPDRRSRGHVTCASRCVHGAAATRRQEGYLDVPGKPRLRQEEGALRGRGPRPAFANARSRAELAALVSDDPEKLLELSRKYGVKHVFTYDEYDACLASGAVDAVYIALPNHMHCGVHGPRGAKGHPRPL